MSETDGYGKERGQEFTQEDEETLVLFASQATMAIANARKHREERWAGAELETFDRNLASGRGGLRRQYRELGEQFKENRRLNTPVPS